MPIAATNEVAVRVIEETVFGTTPATPAYQEMRFTGESLIANKDTVVSEVIRADRQRDFLAEVAASGEGDLEVELAFGDELDLILRGALQAEFVVTDSGDGDTVAAQAMSTVAPPDSTTGGTILGAGATYVTDGIRVGDTITLGSTATQDGDYKVQAVTETVITVEPGIGDAPLASEGPGVDETVTTPLNTINVVDAARTFTRIAGDFLVDQFKVGQVIEFSGFTDSAGANNGFYRIETVTALVITVEAGFGNEPLMIDETGDADERAYGAFIENGTTARSYSIEKEFADVTQFQVFEGMRMGSLSLEIEVGAIVTGTLSWQGRGNVSMAATRIAGATTVAADTTEQFNATSNVGNLFEGGAALTTCLNSISLELENNLRLVPCVGDKFPQEVNSGFVDVSGTLEALFEDEVLFNKFINHTESALLFSWTDVAGNFVVVQLPRIFYGTGSPTAGGGNEEVGLSMEFTAIRESVTGGKTIHFDVIPAVKP